MSPVNTSSLGHGVCLKYPVELILSESELRQRLPFSASRVLLGNGNGRLVLVAQGISIRKHLGSLGFLNLNSVDRYVRVYDQLRH
jgi:hypothetical protein